MNYQTQTSNNVFYAQITFSRRSTIKHTLNYSICTTSKWKLVDRGNLQVLYAGIKISLGAPMLLQSPVGHTSQQTRD